MSYRTCWNSRQEEGKATKDGEARKAMSKTPERTEVAMKDSGLASGECVWSSAVRRVEQASTVP